MADSCCNCNNMLLEVVDDDVHRLLPLENLKDIGTGANGGGELRRIAIRQELSSRLATVLVEDTKGVSSQDHRRRLYPIFDDHYQHHHLHGHPQPQVVYRADNRRGRIADDGRAVVVNAQRANAPSSFCNARTMVRTGIVVVSLPRFAPARLRGHAGVVPPPAKQAASKGTGVFLPRAQLVAYPETASGAWTGGGGGAAADMKPRHRRGNQQVRQLRRQLRRLHAQAGAGASSHGCHDELGLPQEWNY